MVNEAGIKKHLMCEENRICVQSAASQNHISHDYQKSTAENR